MVSFENFVRRHGEIGTQALVEHVERREGIRPKEGSGLYERWRVAIERPGRIGMSMAA